MPPVKNYLIILAFIGLVINCSDDPEVGSSELIGKWQLVEVLLDPGDGSGQFEPIESDKEIDFLSNGKIRSNGALCNPGQATNSITTGYFILPDSILEIDDCESQTPNPGFSVVGSEMILSYACIEPCREKYIKIE